MRNDKSTVIVSVLGEKGGCGKSTIAIAIASELHARGASVVLADGDPQGTSTTWGAFAAGAGRDEPKVVPIGDMAEVELRQLATHATWVIADLPGRLGRRTASALLASDIAIVPCIPSPTDAWTLPSTFRLTDDARALHPDLKAAVLLNRVDRTSISQSAVEAIRSLGKPVLSSSLSDRVAYLEAIASGFGVTRYARSSQAAQEVRDLVDELESLARTSRGIEGDVNG